MLLPTFIYLILSAAWAFSAAVLPSLPLPLNLTLPSTFLISPLNASRQTPAPDPYYEDFGDLHIMLSKFGEPITIDAFIRLYVRCVMAIWAEVAHSPNRYRPPERLPVKGTQFYQNANNHVYFYLRMAGSTAVYWEYGELFGALNVIMKFALNWGMRAMQVEVVVDGPGACGGEVAFVVPRRSRVIGEGG